MKRLRLPTLVPILLLILGCLGSAIAAMPTPPPHLGWWREARFGMFIHWGPAALTGREISWSRASTGPAVYDALPQRFHAENFDARAWVAAAQAAGMRYIVLTAKHHDGFMLWSTKTSAHHVMNTPFGRDVVAELAAAAREAKIPLGLYFSPGDWHDPDCRHPEHNPRFVQRMHAQLTELLTQYGPVPLVWIDFDGWPSPSRPEETATLIRRLQPGVILNNRLEPLHPDESHGRVGRWGDYATPEQRVGSYCDTIPWETCMTIATQWSWRPDDRIKPLQQCLETLVSTVGGDGNLLFNVGPMASGEIEPAQVQRLAEMGAWLRTHGESIHGTRGGPWMPTGSYASTRTATAAYVHLFGKAAPTLPPLPAHVEKATLLDGTPVAFAQTAAGLSLTVPAGRRDAHITVVRLTFAVPPLTLAAIPPASTSGSLAYQRPAAVSSSIAPQFIHTATAALDDNSGTFWSPGRDETLAAGIPGRRFDHFRLMPKDSLWLRSGWLEVDLGRATAISRAVVMEKVDPRNYLPVTSWQIEYETAAGWRTAAAGETLGARAAIAFPRTVAARRFRLHVTAEGRPAIAEFQLLP
jgi:alpha-L-fucosidase